MKYALLICLSLAFLTNVDTQDTQRFVIESMGSTNLNIPQDKVFLHTDRNLYYQGDTIFFQAYIANRFTRQFRTNSHSLWTLLIGPRAETIDSARFRINFSQAAGWLIIPDTCKPGIYRINAFTSMMQNYDPSWAWSMRVKVEEPAHENITYEFQFDKAAYNSNDTAELSIQFKDRTGGYLENTAFSYSTIINHKAQNVYRSKTTREGKTLIRIYLPDSLDRKEIYLQISLDRNLGERRIVIPRHSEQPVISFLPESGYLVAGFNQRIVFNAFSQQGKQLYLQGVIKDNQGNVIDSLSSGHLGPGLVEFVPEAGKKYHAEFNKYPGENFYLPDVTDDHPSIRVDNEKCCLDVDILGNCYDETFYLTLTKDYNIVAFAELKPGNKQKKVKFLTDSLSAGMAKVNLLDSLLSPVAERCVFISRNNVPRFNVTPEFEYYLPVQETELQIGININEMRNVSGIFSVAVIDSSNGLSPQLALRSIEDEFLFEKEFYERIPHHIKKTGLSNLDAGELDLILLTYGWSRFLRDFSGEEGQINIVDYDRYIIDINYLRSFAGRRNKGPKGNPIFIIAPEEQTVIDLKASGNNSYFLETDSLPLSTNSIMIVPDQSATDKFEAWFKPVVNNSYFDMLGKPVEQVDAYSSSIIRVNEDYELDIDSIIVIKGIDVFARRTPAKEFSNAYEERYQNLSTRTIDGLAIESAMTFEDLLRRLHPMHLNTVDKKICFRPTGKFGGDPPPALFVLDGIPQETSYSYLMNLKPEHIHSVTALIGTSGFFIYGEDAIGGVVFIETKLNHPGSIYDSNKDVSVSGGDLRRIIHLFRPGREFYSPPVEVMENDPAYWIRPTIYWNPEVFYDGQKPVKIQYANHRKKGTVFIIANGVTIDGDPVFGVSKYKIK